MAAFCSDASRHMSFRSARNNQRSHIVTWVRVRRASPCYPWALICRVLPGTASFDHVHCLDGACMGRAYHPFVLSSLAPACASPSVSKEVAESLEDQCKGSLLIGRFPPLRHATSCVGSSKQCNVWRRLSQRTRGPGAINPHTRHRGPV